MKDFKGKTAIITGAASGIGLELARIILSQHGNVVMADINQDLLEESASKLKAGKSKVTTCALDVTDREAVTNLVESTVSQYGRLDYLFNNAGIGVGGEARDYEFSDWQNVLDVNLNGVINGVHAAYPIMVKQGFGHIINVSSLAGLVPFPGEISYTTSKYAVVGLTHTLRAEGAALGVKVSLVCPGKIETPIYENSRVINFNKKEILARLPKGITPEACARIIIKGVNRNKATIVITPLAKALWILHRISPQLILNIGVLYMKKMRELRLEGA